MNYNNLYYTDNPEYASFLLASKQVLESLYWSKGACVFVFENETECKKIISGIKEGEILVGGPSLIEAIKTIQGIINLKVEN